MYWRHKNRHILQNNRRLKLALSHQLCIKSIPIVIPHQRNDHSGQSISHSRLSQTNISLRTFVFAYACYWTFAFMTLMNTFGASHLPSLLLFPLRLSDSQWFMHEPNLDLIISLTLSLFYFCQLYAYIQEITSTYFKVWTITVNLKSAGSNGNSNIISLFYYNIIAHILQSHMFCTYQKDHRANTYICIFWTQLLLTTHSHSTVFRCKCTQPCM